MASVTAPSHQGLNILGLLRQLTVTTMLPFELTAQTRNSLLRLLSRCFQLHQVRPRHVQLPFHLRHFNCVLRRACLQRGDALLDCRVLTFQLGLLRRVRDATVLRGMASR